MKQLRYFILLSVCAAMAGLMSCGDDGPKLTPEEVQLNLLARDWAVSSVEVDNLDITSNFSGLVVTFTSEKDFSTNGDYGPVWPNSGTFDFGADLNTINRSDGVTLTLSAITETSVTVAFTFSVPGARPEGIYGSYVCQFTSQ